MEEISEIKNDHERRVALFLHHLGFTPKAFNPIIAENKKQIGEIDSIFEYGDWLFLIEVSTGTRLVNEKKNFFFSKWTDKHNLQVMRNQCKLKSKKVVRIYFDLIKDPPENHEGLDHITERVKGNKVVWRKIFENYQTQLKTSIPNTRSDFLKYLEI